MTTKIASQTIVVQTTVFRETKPAEASDGSSDSNSQQCNPMTSVIVTTMFDSPLGHLLAAATDDGICLLDYVDESLIARNLATMRKRFAASVVPGEHVWLQRLSDELAAYFDGRSTDSTVPVAPRGTPFQERVWAELRRIPHGETISYEELAARIGQPTAVRAVANANGQNRINLVIPCHRVIGKNGSLTGYGGGLWRKRLLLEHERDGSWPQHLAAAHESTHRLRCSND